MTIKFLSKPQFNYIQDPGHGWIEVPKDLAHAFGFQDKITSYSFHNRDFYYLEEDLDAGLLFKALRANKTGYILKEKHSNNDSFVRSLARVGGAS